MSHLSIPQPSRIAVWLLELFAANEQAEPIRGDLLEEFSVIASESGAAAARGWHWRQSLKTVAHLVWSGYRSAPWLIAATTSGGFLLLRFAERLPERCISAFFDVHPGYYEAHFQAYMFWVTYGIEIGIVIMATLVGCAIAAVARGKEIIATMAVAFLTAALVGAPYSVWFTLRIVRHWPLYASLTFPQICGVGLSSFVNAFAGSIMLVLGGAVVRKIRSIATRRA
jgi:hypothetical protein